MSTTATIPDLWPEDFGVKGKEPSPSAILRQQGYRLGERTRDVVYGEVESGNSGGNNFHHFLHLAAPYMKVRQKVVSVGHELSPYPAQVYLHEANGSISKSVEAVDSDHFIEVLREMLAAPHIVELIGSLISQARDLDGEE